MGTPVPSDVENTLTAAKAHGDWDGYVRVLLTADVFGYVDKGEADRLGSQAEFPLYDGPGGGPYGGPFGQKCFVAHTRGELLPPRPDQVPIMVPVPMETKKLPGGLPPGLWVNPGTPSEAYFPGAAETFRHWEALGKQVRRDGHDGDALVTKYTGPLHGPLAHGLACGGHLAAHRRVFWNDIGDVYDDYLADAASLGDDWGVKDRPGWHEQLTSLLEGRNGPPQPEFALTVRQDIARGDPGAAFDPRAWSEAAAAALRARGGDEQEVGRVLAVIDRILRHEARFRADGVLPPDGYVTSVLAHDYGRAVNFARWGLGARYATPYEVEQAVLRVGELCRERYPSWEAFSAGYVLGHVLRADTEDAAFGHAYGAVLGPHRVLVGDPAGPWRNIPFQQAASS